LVYISFGFVLNAKQNVYYKGSTDTLCCSGEWAKCVTTASFWKKILLLMWFLFLVDMCFSLAGGGWCCLRVKWSAPNWKHFIQQIEVILEFKMCHHRLFYLFLNQINVTKYATQFCFVWSFSLHYIFNWFIDNPDLLQIKD
jgi:hypothetical protein